MTWRVVYQLYKFRPLDVPSVMGKGAPPGFAISACLNDLLNLIDRLPAQGITLTRGGRPIARLVPVRETNTDLIGSVPGIVAESADDLFETGLVWEAQTNARRSSGVRRSRPR